MSKVIKLWIKRAVKEALAILDTGDQKAFDEWKKRYSKMIAEEDTSWPAEDAYKDRC